MRQLDLFERFHRATPAPAPWSFLAEAADPGRAPEPQLDLFAERPIQLEIAWAAIAEGRLEEADRALASLRARHPDDAAVRQHATRVSAICRQIAEVRALPGGPRAAALLALARDVDRATGAWGALRRRLLRDVAEALLESEERDDAELDGEPPGHYLLEAGAPLEAQASLSRALLVRRRARTLFLLGDATFVMGSEAAARRLYLEALLRDPFDAALAAARDEAIRALPDVARDELEIEHEPTAWSAPVGVVLGVLPMPARPQGDAPPEEPAPCGERTPSQREALAAARRFIEALGVASAPLRRGDDAVIEARRTMKRLAPSLFAVYLERHAAGRRG